MSDTIPYIDRFPEGHEHAGAIVGRKAKCTRCEQEFVQVRINPAFIDSIRVHRGVIAAESFKASLERRSNGFYSPAFCPRCTRKIA